MKILLGIINTIEKENNIIMVNNICKKTFLIIINKSTTINYLHNGQVY